MNALLPVLLMAVLLNPADAPWVLLADGEVQTGQQWRLDPDGNLLLRQMRGSIVMGEETPASPAVLLAADASPAALPPGQVRVTLGNGEVLLGTLADSGERNTLVLESEPLGRQRLALSEIRSLDFGHAQGDRAAGGRVEFAPPYVLLMNGDVLPGAIGAITSGTVAVDSEFGEIETDRERVARVVVAEGTEADRPAGAFLLETRDSRRWFVTDPTPAGQKVQFLRGERPVSLEPGNIRLLVWPGWTLAPLIEREPDSIETTPYLEEAVEVTVDTADNPRPLAAGSVTALGGITTRPRSRVTFTLPETAAYLTGAVGLDPLRGANGNAAVAVDLNGNTELEVKELTAATGAVEFALPLEGSTTLGLTTDFGENAERGDIVNWCRLLLVEKR